MSFIVLFRKSYRKTQIKVWTWTSTIYLPLTSGLWLSATWNISPVANTILYTGREYDREVNLYYLRARYYDPSTSRFISRDPIWTNDQINLYTYVRNNPLIYVDRDGKIAKRFIVRWWKAYLDLSDEAAEALYNSLWEYNEDIIKSLDNTRRNSWYAWLVAMPFLLFPPTTPLAAGIIGATGVMSLTAWWIESYWTQDIKYFKQEFIIAATSKIWWTALQWYLKNTWKATEVTYNTSAWRYMGQSPSGAYWFIKNTVWQASVAISQWTEQFIGYVTQKLAGD